MWDYKRRKKYIVVDTLGYVLRTFSTHEDAMNFKFSRGRYDWKIVEK